MAIKVSKSFRWKTVNEKLKDNYFLFILKFEYSLIVYDIIISTSIVQSTLNVKQLFFQLLSEVWVKRRWIYITMFNSLLYGGMLCIAYSDRFNFLYLYKKPQWVFCEIIWSCIIQLYVLFPLMLVNGIVTILF